ncbi:MAG: metallophosphoesterase family protein [Solirubrobacteraceae bacterium]
MIFGHSHIPLHERGEDGFQIFNPGSPTERRRAPARTMGMARVRAGKLTFELVTLE